MALQDYRRDAVQAQRAQLPDRVLLLADRCEVALRAEAGMEVVLRGVEYVRLVEQLVEEFVDLPSARRGCRPWLS